MQTKQLFMFISNGGDGSYSIHYTFDESLVDLLQAAYDNDLMDYDDVGVDGDGFGYSILNVPVECTAESLGISWLMDKQDYVERFGAEYDDEEGEDE